jgi:hypothetical protein
MKSFICSSVSLLAAVMTLPAQNTPPAPVPRGTGAVAGSTPPASATAGVAEASDPVDPTSPEDLKQYGLDRYDKIIEKSPFNFKIVTREGPPAISFAADLALAGFTIDAGKGIKYASIVDKKKNLRFVINNQAPNKEGIQLVDLRRGQTLLASTVLARKGSEEQEIKAEKQIVERKAVVSPAVAAAGRGGQPGQPQTGMPAGGPGRPNDVRERINNTLQLPNPPVPPKPLWLRRQRIWPASARTRVGDSARRGRHRHPTNAGSSSPHR